MRYLVPRGQVRAGEGVDLRMQGEAGGALGGGGLGLGGTLGGKLLVVVDVGSVEFGKDAEEEEAVVEEGGCVGDFVGGGGGRARA